MLDIMRKSKEFSQFFLSVQTIVRRNVLSPRDERTLVRKVQINPRTRAKDLERIPEETGTKVSISTV